MLQAAQLIICHLKSKIYENFRKAIPGKKQNMFIAILLSFIITFFANLIYSELANSIQVETYSEPYQRFKMQFLAKIVNISKGVFQNGVEDLKWSFLRKCFSCSLFTQKAPSQMFDSVLNTPLELLPIFAKSSS